MGLGLIWGCSPLGNEGNHGGKIAVGAGSVESDLPRHRTGVERVRCGARLGRHDDFVRGHRVLDFHRHDRLVLRLGGISRPQEVAGQHPTACGVEREQRGMA